MRGFCPSKLLQREDDEFIRNSGDSRGAVSSLAVALKIASTEKLTQIEIVTTFAPRNIWKVKPTGMSEETAVVAFEVAFIEIPF